MASLTIRGKTKNNGIIKFNNDDDYYTPKSAWEAIKDYIPKDKIIWESFYGDGTSANYLREIGFNVISEQEDFFENNKGEIIISNPPFSDKVKIFKRLKELDKPFILIFPVSTITKKFYQDYFADKCGILIPPKRIHFIKNGEQTSRSWFDVVYICYKIDKVSKREMIYLNY
jgi:hypothetical protein